MKEGNFFSRMARNFSVQRSFGYLDVDTLTKEPINKNLKRPLAMFFSGRAEEAEKYNRELAKKYYDSGAVIMMIGAIGWAAEFLDKSDFIDQDPLLLTGLALQAFAAVPYRRAAVAFGDVCELRRDAIEK